MGSCFSHADHIAATPVTRGRLSEITYEDTKEPTYDFTEAKVIKVYDGDTLTIGVYHINGFKRFNVRLYGVDCDEMRGGTEQTRAHALKAKIFVQEQVLGKVVKIHVLNNKIYEGKMIKEKYGRLIAVIYTPRGDNLADMLLAAGLARKYYGGSKS
jgi:endonuclease YncB( thermonuclease family)